MTTPADGLRLAAARLRMLATHAAAAADRPLVYYEAPSDVIEWHAAMHPGVGLAVAEWLEAAADFHDDQPCGFECVDDCMAEVVARLINGGAS